MQRVRMVVRQGADNFQRLLRFLVSVTSLETQNATASIVVGLTFIATSIWRTDLYVQYAEFFKYMAWVPTWTWGVAYVTAGVLHLLAIYTGLSWYRKQIVLAKAGLWLFLALCVLQAEPYAATGWIFLVFAYSAVMVFLRIRLNKAGLPTDDSNVLARS